MKTKEILSWVLGFAVGIPIFLSLWSLATEMMTASSDLAVLCGFVLLIASIVGLGVGIYSLAVRIKKFYGHKLFPVVLIALTLGLNACTKVEPGYVGIKVNQYGTQKGVEDFPLVTGRVWYNWFSEDVYKFPTFLQNIVWTKDRTEGSPNDDSITFNSIEGAVLNADIALSYGFDGAKVPALFIEFRQDPQHITNVYMRSKVRDYFSREASIMKVVDIFGAKKQEILQNVKEDLIAELGPKGFRFDMISFVGALRVDERVAGSINAVIEATQRAIEAENKIRQSDAEAQQRIATANGEAQSILAVAKAQAEANELVAKSLTPELVQWQAIQRWNGIMPQVTGSGGIPLIQLEKY